MRSRLLRVPWVGLCPRLQLPRRGVDLVWLVMSHTALGGVVSSPPQWHGRRFILLAERRHNQFPSWHFALNTYFFSLIARLN